MREITVTTENKVGVLADICETLGGVGVNLKAISAHGEGNKGIIKVITEDEVTAKNALEKAGYEVRIGDVITIKVRDRPGELGKVARKLANSRVNIGAVYLMAKANNNEVELAITPEKVSEALSALKK